MIYLSDLYLILQGGENTTAWQEHPQTAKKISPKNFVWQGGPVKLGKIPQNFEKVKVENWKSGDKDIRWNWATHAMRWENAMKKSNCEKEINSQNNFLYI